MGKSNSIGVLFVHGIGSQQKGETLVRFGEPVVEWIKHWFAGATWAWARAGQPGRTDQSINSIEHAEGSATEPTAFTLHLSFRDQTREPVQESWHFAECHWAESFPRPDTNDVNSWLILVTPMVVSMHLARQIRMLLKRLRSRDGTLDETPDGNRPRVSASQRFVLTIAKVGTCWQLVISILLFLISPLIALVTLVCLLLLRAIGLIPFGPTTKLVQTVQDVMSTIIGDSWIFVSSPLRASFIDERFKRDLQCMRNKCDQVVVVAHSQGSAIAWRGLNMLFAEGGLGKDTPIFISLGSGLAKLDHLSKRESKEPARVNYQVIFAFTLMWPLLVSAAYLFSGWVFVIVLLVASLGFVNFLMWGWFASEHNEVLAYSQFLGSNMLWKDYVSTADPVPNGPLDRDQLNPHFRSKEVSNSGSLLADHNAYWTNLDEFVGDVLTFISRNTKTGIPLHAITPIDQLVIEAASQVRRWQVRLLVLCRWLLRLMLILALLLPGNTHTIGQRINQWIAPIVGTFDKVTVDSAAGYLGNHTTVGIVSILFGYLFFSEMLTLLYQWENAKEIRRWYFRRMPMKGSEFGIGLSIPVGMSVALLSIMLGVTSMLWSIIFGFAIAALIVFFAIAAYSSIDDLPVIAELIDKS